MRASVFLVLALTATAAAGPRAGANHRAGDDAFVAAFGRAPDARDSEELRMHTHLVWVRARLGAAVATSPELATRRGELLGYLDDYIAKGTTPRNTYVPWRSPVFIDRDGAVCAVGYLIERSAGRALAEQIASAHRLSFLEDIAARAPAVRAWIATSGFTLDELATIQPAYAEPDVQTWAVWDLAKQKPADGLYAHDGIPGVGPMRGGHMHGTWSVTDVEGGALLGIGEMTRGTGDWTSFYADGTKRGEGRYVRDRAQGRWRFYHPSGRVAAEGRFDAGVRVGRWTFFYDDASATPIARGSFASDGAVTGTWKHFDPQGALVARTWTETPAQFADGAIRVSGGEGFVLEVVTGADGVVQRRHLGSPNGLDLELTFLAQGDQQLLVHRDNGGESIYDTEGNLLARTETGAWTTSRCHWSEKRKAIARSGDVARLHGLLFQDIVRVYGGFDEFSGPGHVEDKDVTSCDETRALDAARVKALEALLATRDEVRSPAPAFAVAGTRDEDDQGEVDLVDELARGMQMYQQWTHVDGVFIGAFDTMPGRFARYWHSSDPEDVDAR